MGQPNELDVHREIRARIVNGTFRAGHRLVEMELCEEFGAGRTHVRQALARLEHDGLVVKDRGRSAIVRRVPRTELLEIIEARVALEAIVARNAAVRRTEAEAATLTSVLSALERRADASDISGVLEAQAAFHHVILEASRQVAFQRIVHNLAALTAQTRLRSMLLPGRIPASVKEHRAIAGAVAARDADAAAKAMVAHLRGVGHAISKLPDMSTNSLKETSARLQEIAP